MRSSMLGLLVGVVAATLSSCGSDSSGPCAVDADCGRGRTCDPDLGCVPDTTGDGDADTDTDTDADADGESDADGDGDTSECAQLNDECKSGDAQACELYSQQCPVPPDCGAQYEQCRIGDPQACLTARQEGCPLPDDCDSLRILCELGDLDACLYSDNGSCDPTACPLDGICDLECPGDPDCDPLPGCADSCGPLPDTAGDYCSWVCIEGVECVLQTREPDIGESCISADGQAWDEDCDGLVDCADPDCANTETCR